jgi:hypothetical protein
MAVNRAALIIAAAILSCCGLTASAQPPPLARPQSTPTDTDTLKHYEFLLESYRLADVRAAVRELSGFSEAQVKQVTWRWFSAAGAPRLTNATPDQLRLAAMFHTDCAFALIWSRRGSFKAHLTLAQSLADAAEPGTPPTGSFRRRWYLAALMFLHRAGQQRNVVEPIRDAALAAFPDDARILLEAGAIDEDWAIRLEPSPLYLFNYEGLDKVRALRQGYLYGADLYLKRALAADADLTEAALRLAHVRAELGHRSDAAAGFQQVLDSSSVPEFRYLAALFLGQVQEADGRLDDARRSYRAALDLYPPSQVARTALAHMSFRQGQAVDALALVREALTIRAERDDEDPWWRYPKNQFLSFDDLLVGLREEVRR